VDYNYYPDYPDPAITPGDVFDVTESDVCTPGYSSSVRSVSTATKKKVYQNYEISYPPPSRTYEVDHFIPLELGGSNNILNLWPQPYSGTWNSRVKDRLETYLHKLVCQGALTLADAQDEISSDWIAAYQYYFGG